MIKIRYVQGNDKNFWYSLDKHLSVEEFAKKVANQQDYVLLVDGIGSLKDDFWADPPFCTMLYIDEKYQNLRYGKILKKWYEMVLTATSVNENA